MKGHDTFRQAVDRLSEATVDAAAAAGRPLDEIDLFAYHQANGRILTAVGERLGPRPRRGSSTASAATATPRRRRSRWRSPRPATTGRLTPGSTVLLAAFGGGLTWAATVIEWGVRRGERRCADGCALVTGSARGIGAATRDRARRRRAGRWSSTTAPTPRAPRPWRRAIDGDGGARDRDRRRRHRPRAGRGAVRRAPRRSSGRCWCSSTTPACAPTGSPRSSTTEQWEQRARHQPLRRLPHDPAGAAADAARPLRPDRQRRLDRRPPRQRRARPTTRPRRRA